MNPKNLDIIGTSHIAKESVQSVTHHIETKKPDIVAVELDARRAHALLNNSNSKVSLKMIRVIGVKGFAFYALASFLQKKLGKIVGVTPGSDMKAAIWTAHKQKAKIALIDRDLSITMKRLSNQITWKERFKFLKDAFSGPFSSEFKELRTIDLRKVPSKTIILKIIKHLKKNYPGIYNVLIEERNKHMASSLAHLMKHHPEKKILAVVGAGHEEEIMRMVKNASETKNDQASQPQAQ